MTLNVIFTRISRVSRPFIYYDPVAWGAWCAWRQCRRSRRNISVDAFVTERYKSSGTDVLSGCVVETKRSEKSIEVRHFIRIVCDLQLVPTLVLVDVADKNSRQIPCLESKCFVTFQIESLWRTGLFLHRD